MDNQPTSPTPQDASDTSRYQPDTSTPAPAQQPEWFSRRTYPGQVNQPTPDATLPQAQYQMPNTAYVPQNAYPGAPGHSNKKMIIIVVAVMLVALFAGGFLLLAASKPAKKTTTTATKTVNPKTVAPTNVVMMHDYINSWVTNPTKAKSYLNLTKLKQNTTCPTACTDASIINPENSRYTDPTSIIDSVISVDKLTVKVYTHTKSNTISTVKSGYTYKLETSGSSLLIDSITAFTDK